MSNVGAVTDTLTGSRVLSRSIVPFECTIGTTYR